MKKGKLGTIALIVGIVIFACGIIAGVTPDSIIGRLAKVGQILWFAAPILGIIAIVKKSNTVQAIIGIVLGAVGFFAPWVILLIVNAIK